MLDSVKAGDTVELSLLLAFMAAGLIFQPYCSDDCALAEVWPCERQRGVEGLSMA